MKIAVQLFGHMRTYNRCYANLRQNLLSRYDCDVFMHTWSTLDHRTETHHSNRMINANTDTHALAREYYGRMDRQGIGQLIIETQENKDLGGITTTHNRRISLHGIHCMLHSMAEANRLREEYARAHHVMYDFVLCIRPDILLKREFDIEKMISGLRSEVIDKSLFTTGYPYFQIINEIKYYGATDVLFFARPEIISNMMAHISQVAGKLTSGLTYDYGIEYCLIQTVQDLGYNTYLTQYALETHFDILRSATPANLRKKMIRFRMRREYLSLYLLQLLVHQILRIRLNLLGKFEIDLCIGALNDKLRK